MSSTPGGGTVRQVKDRVEAPPRSSANMEPAREGSRSSGRWLRAQLGTASLILVWIGLIVVFGILEPDTFLTYDTFRSVASAQAITVVIALALVAPIAANVFDLSVAANMSLAVVLVAWLQADAGTPWMLAVLLTLLAGLLVGAFNALVVVGLEVNSFIATLGSMSILMALTQAVTGGNPIVQGISPSFIDLGIGQFLGLSLPFFYMVTIALILRHFMQHRQTGRFLYATGSNIEAARLAGVRTARIVTISLLISGGIAALAGVIFTMTIGSAAVDAGSSYLLPAFAAAFLGATQFRSGRVNVLGTVMAVYVLATGIKGLQLAGAPFWVEDLFYGAALIVAVAFSVRAARRRGAGSTA